MALPWTLEEAQQEAVNKFALVDFFQKNAIPDFLAVNGLKGNGRRREGAAPSARQPRESETPPGSFLLSAVVDHRWLAAVAPTPRLRGRPLPAGNWQRR